MQTDVRVKQQSLALTTFIKNCPNPLTEKAAGAKGVWATSSAGWT